MTARRSNQLGVRRNSTGRDGVSAMSSYLAAGVIHAILITIAEIPSVHAAFLRLGWKLGQWPSFPFPYDLKAYASGPLLNMEVQSAYSVYMTFALASTVAIAVAHSLIFGVILVGHICLGWPRYWKDVRSRLTLQAIWATSARRCWWVWPAGQFVWILLDQLALAYRYGHYPLIDNGPPFFAANILAISLVFGGITSGVIRASIIRAIERGDVRCGRCGYLLRGLAALRCPECGYGGHLGGKIEYTLRRRRSVSWIRIRRWPAIGLVVALFLSPVWLPLGLMRVPRQWLQSIPRAIRPSPELINPIQDRFPIRLDAICVIRNESALAIIRFQPKNISIAEYNIAYWSDVSDVGIRRPPELLSEGHVSTGGSPFLLIGPWSFSYWIGNQNMFWLIRPDETFSVEAFEPDGLPSEFSWRSPSNWSDQQSGTLGEQ